MASRKARICALAFGFLFYFGSAGYFVWDRYSVVPTPVTERAFVLHGLLITAFVNIIIGLLLAMNSLIKQFNQVAVGAINCAGFVINALYSP